MLDLFQIRCKMLTKRSCLRFTWEFGFCLEETTVALKISCERAQWTFLINLMATVVLPGKFKGHSALSQENLRATVSFSSQGAKNVRNVGVLVN